MEQTHAHLAPLIDFGHCTSMLAKLGVRGTSVSTCTEDNANHDYTAVEYIHIDKFVNPTVLLITHNEHGQGLPSCLSFSFCLLIFSLTTILYYSLTRLVIDLVLQVCIKYTN